MPDYSLMAEALSRQGLAPYGTRFAEDLGAPTAKGKGYFGEIPDAQGRPMTELSSAYEDNGKLVSHPLVVPTLTKEEIDLLKMGILNEQIYQKAEDWAKSRLGQGQSPFATPQDVRFPVPTE
jgi:hypothetical protein